MENTYVFLQDIHSDDPDFRASYVRSRLHCQLHQMNFQADKFALSADGKTCQARYAHTLDDIFNALSPKAFEKNDLRLYQADVKCALSDVSQMLPLFEGEKIKQDAFHYLRKDIDGFQKNTPVLIRTTNYASFMAIFDAYRISPRAKRMKTVVSNRALAMQANNELSLTNTATIVSTSVSLVSNIASGNVTGVVSALAGLVKFLAGITSPAEEPLTKQMRHIFEEVISDTFISLFNSNLKSIATYFNTQYFPRLKPRSEMTDKQIKENFDKLDRYYLEVLKLRDAAGGAGFEEVGLPTYIAAQNFMLMILDQMAQYDPETTNKHESTIYKVAIPTIVDQGKFHLLNIWPKIAQGRKDKVKLERKTGSGSYPVIWNYWINDTLTGRQTGTVSNRALANGYGNTYRRQVQDQEYENFRIRQELSAWEQMHGVTPQKLVFDYQQIKISSRDLIYSSAGAEGSHGDLLLYVPNKPKMPPGFNAVCSYACVNSLPKDASVLIIKGLEPGVLVDPVRYELIWTSKKSGSNKAGSIWKPIAPSGYVALGHVASNSSSRRSSLSNIKCIRSDLAGSTLMNWLWNDNKTGAEFNGTVWSVTPEAATPSGGFISVRGKWGKDQDLVDYAGIKECFQLYVQKYQ